MKPEQHALSVEDSSRVSPRILEAVDYIEQCRMAGRRFAVVTGPSAAEHAFLVERFLGTVGRDARVVRLTAPIESSHRFLEAILGQLGFEPFESTADDLMRLLVVVLRQAAEQTAPVCIVLDAADSCGPRVFEALRELVRRLGDAPGPPLFLLTGTVGLLRVLDSAGMAAIAASTRHRFDLSASASAAVPRPMAQEDSAELVVSLDGEILQRFPLLATRLLVGRGAHCDVCIRSRFVSRQHALLIRNADGDWLVDLNSTNGTSVNSKRIAQQRLVNGDVVTIGNYRIQYRNAAGRWSDHPVPPGDDQLAETTVMRSLRSLRSLGAAAGPSRSSAA